MKILAWIFGILFGLVALFGIVQTLASERVEVVELHTLDEAGETVTTRLWVMDHDGFQYLRVGGDGSGWFSRIEASETIQVTRNDETRTYTIVTRPDKSDLINDLMSKKYTWGDDFFATMFGSRDGSIPVELHEVME
jgi:predicted outer membrane lipoprotein